MRASALRLTRQQLLFSSRRYASTSTNTAAKAANNASNTAATSAAKARDTATKAAGKAMEILGKSGETFANIAAKTGGRTGQALKAVQSAIPPTIYYSKVALELSKIVFRAQKMNPPDWSTFQSTFQATFRPLLNPANAVNYARQFVTFARSASQKELAYFGVLGAEILGFFTVGEIVGRRKLIGYRGDTRAHH